MGISQSWHYKWRDRAPTARQRRRADLDAQIEARFTASGGTYDSPCITRDLHEAGWRVSENTVAGRMAVLGLAGRVVRKRRSLTRQGKRPAALDLVRRNFTAVAPDVLWCGDVTEIVTDEGKLYLATVEDLFSRRLLGYAMSEHHDATLTIASLQMAAVTRGGTVDGVIFHTGRGSEGGFNWSSQHLDRVGGCCGAGKSTCGDFGRSSAASVTRTASGQPAPGAAAFLAADRRRAGQRGGRPRVRCVDAVRTALVS
ncbi:DDE-type integrase/transposase/recombinase [Streptosporangium vulgare]|uniref:DDE-type integrase/transposase/recombinase n=1 Tax=Streptosporangium vulgare TaxID=46190 RepID=A0ABV5TS92_9ACTN